jgi:hypothetical protein
VICIFLGFASSTYSRKNSESMILIIYHFLAYLVKALNSFKWLNSINSPRSRSEGYIIL